LKRRWLQQATLGLTMIAHASMRGVVEFMHDVMGMWLCHVGEEVA
jgi:hypothetical protein